MKPVQAEVDPIALEEEILEYWRTSRAFERLRELRADAPHFRFVDGPITANNRMGVHHAWGRTLKDAFLRYRAMQGQLPNYQNGFDCQGLWVEVEVEKALGFNGKPDIERFGIDNFARACRERVDTYAGVISKQSMRLGQWMDWDNSYFTFTDQNMTSIWAVLKKCHERGLIYRGSLPMPWCPRCGTSLSEHEMAGSYETLQHLSVYGRLPLRGEPTRRLLAWTTTPWTLPANVALAVHPELEYVEVRHPSWDHTLVLGAGVLRRVLGEQRVEVLRRFKGAELVGLQYETFFPDFPAQAGVDHRVVAWEDVDEAEGAGIVHIAPGCGLADYELGQKLGLPAIEPVDEAAVYRAGFGWLEGRLATEVAQDVVDRLDAAGKVLRSHMHEHSYPMCWRCKGELIFRLVGEWFIATEPVRPQLIEAARTVQWQPDYIGKRMEDWLANMGDWCISRKRYWGLALPFYSCGQCGTVTVVGSREELRERALEPALVDGLPELHRPWIDAVQIRCSKCSAPTARVPEVGDCWLDAGIVPYSTLGYFEDRARWEQWFPVEWVCEMREQVRLWYYSMLFMSVLLEGRAPYRKVLSYERVVAEDGTKFSKSGFMIVFDDAVARMGADAIRYLFCRQPPGSEARFGYQLGELARRRLSSLWNVYSFLVTYALVDRPDSYAVPASEQLHTTDRWLLARTREFAERARGAYEQWDTPALIKEFEEYADELSNWYVRVNRRRFWRSGNRADKQAAYGALYTALKTAVQALAPITPFMSEAIWQNLVRSAEPEAPESVHHSRFAELPRAWVDHELLRGTAVVRDLISEALRLRQQSGVRVRQPLRALHVIAPPAALAVVREQEEIVRSELNVARVHYAESAGELELERVQLDFKAAGPVVRGEVNRLKQLVEQLDEPCAAAAAAAVRAGEPVPIAGFERALPPEIFRVRRVLREGVEAGRTAALELRLEMALDDNLFREGLARDLIRRIQVARREANLDITQRIELALQTDAPELQAAIETHEETICEEVLAVRLLPALEAAALREEWTIQNLAVQVALQAVPGSN